VFPTFAGIAGKKQSVGSGVVVAPNGYVLTGAHLVAPAATVVVAVGRVEHAAVVVAMDEEHDLALLKVDKAGMPSLTVGSLPAAPAGQPLAAFGYVLTNDTADHYTHAAAPGVEVRLASRSATGELTLNAPVNAGFAGAALVLANGDLVGTLGRGWLQPGLRPARGWDASVVAKFAEAHGAKLTPGGAPLQMSATDLGARVSPAIGAVIIVPKNPVPAGAWAPPLPRSDGSLTSGEPVAGAPRYWNATAVAWSPDGATLAVARYTGTYRPCISEILLIDSATHEVRRTLTGHTNGVDKLAYSPDGQMVASRDLTGHVFLWKADTSALWQKLPGAAESIAFSPDSRDIACQNGATSKASVFEVATGKPKCEATPYSVGVRGLVRDVAYSPLQGLLLMPGCVHDSKGAYGKPNTTERKLLYLFDPNTGVAVNALVPEIVPTMDNRKHWVRVSPNETRVAIYGGIVGKPVGWHMFGVDGTRLPYLYSLPTWGRHDVEFSQDGRLFAYGQGVTSWFGISFACAETGSTVFSLKGQPHFRLSPDRRKLAPVNMVNGASMAGSGVALWDLSALKGE